MKINRIALSMALVGACLPGSKLFAQSPPNFFGAGSGRISDGSTDFGDSNPSLSKTYPTSTPSRFASNESSVIADYSPSTDDHASHDYSSVACSPCATNRCTANSSLYWGQFESLLWFSGDRPTVPLATSNGLGLTPELPGGTVLAGGSEAVGSGLLPGFRGNVGMWLDNCKSLGVGGSVFGLFGRDQTETFNSDGSTSLGIPFFNVTQGVQDAYLVAFNAGNLGSNTGSISIGSRIDMIGAEAYLRSALIQSGNSRVDLIGGYLFTRLDDSLTISSTLVDGITNAIPNGTVFQIDDSFGTKNRFHGGQIGVVSESQSGRWTFSSGAKFGLGNMNQESQIAGNYVETGVGATTQSRGLFAQSSNIGTQTRNVFTFIPQVDLKLGYLLNNGLRVHVGYSLMYLDDVALAGNQVDPNIDIGNIFAAPSAPQARFVSDSLILHGINLGLSFDF